MKEFIKAFFSLQFFADAGSLTNVTATSTSGSYQINSYTGTPESADASHSMAVELKDFYDTELLENAYKGDAANAIEVIE